MHLNDDNSENCFYVNQFRVDTGNNTITLGSQRKQVEPRAMQVLRVLAAHSGETVTRVNLLKLVWGDRVVVEEALTRIISQLRAALNDSKSRQLIQTVPKKGYRLNAVVEEEEQPNTVVTEEAVPDHNVPPDTTEAEAPPQPSEPILKSVRGPVYWAVIGVIAVFLCVLLYLPQNRHPGLGQSVLTSPSIAVLPLQKLTQDKETLYLAEGLPEELLNELAKIPGLEVPSHYSTFALAEREGTGADIAAALNVRYLLEGSVRNLGNEFKITVRLVDTSDDRIIWSESYENSASQLYDIPDDIAANIISALLPEKSSALVNLNKTSVDSVEAYQYYLKGRYWLMNGKTSEWFYRAETAFLNAINADASYAAAHGSLAYIYARHDYHDKNMGGEQAVKKAREAISTALKIQPDEINALLAEAILSTSSGDYSLAQNALERVIEISPNNATALYLFSELELARNHHDKALAYALQAKNKDSLSPWINVNLAIVQFWRGEFEAALNAVNTAIRIDNDYTWAYVWKAKILQHQGDTADAIHAMKISAAIDAASPINNAYLGLLYLELGLTEQAQLWFDKTAVLYGDTADARVWQQFLRFVYRREDEDIANTLLQQLSLLDNRIFSLLPVLYYIEKEKSERIAAGPFARFRETWLRQKKDMNFLNQHQYIGASKLYLKNDNSDMDEGANTFQNAVAPPGRKGYLYSTEEQAQATIYPWLWMKPDNAWTEEQHQQYTLWQKAQISRL